MDVDYEQLLTKALKEFDSFSLVWRESDRFKDEAKKFTKRLEPYLISKIRTNRWPGTKIRGGKAIVRTYKVCPESISELRVVSDVFAWLPPYLPEDLAFYKNDKVVFTSIAHERIASFDAT